MIIFDLMIVALFIMSVILLSGVKIMFNSKYFQLIIPIFIMYTPISELIEGYKQNYIDINSIIIINIVPLLIVICGYRINRYIYSIHNVKEDDVMNIIEKYLERKNIKYEVRGEEIYLPDICKTIFVRSSMEITLNCRDIKYVDFYNELVEEVRAGIKGIKQRHFSMEGIFYLIFTVFFYWIRVTFLK